MNKPSPFPPAVKRKPTKSVEIDPTLLKIETGVPVPQRRSRASSKYAEVFGKLKPGSCIRCEPREVSPISNVLHKAMKGGQLPALKDCKIVSRRVCDDGHGRIWAVKDDAK